MTTREESGRSSLFLVGLMAGTAIGAGLALAFAPRMASELGERLTESATDLGQMASRGAREVEQVAEGAKSSPGGWRS